MRIRKRFAVLAVAAVLLAALLAWRLLPRTFSQVSGSDGRQPQVVSCIWDSLQLIDGEFVPDTAELQGLAPDDEAYTRVIELLSQTQYRPALRNLLPWPQTASPGMTECAAYLLLTLDAETADATYLMVMDDNLLAVQLPGSEGLLIYYPDDPAALRSLQGYLAGTAQSAVQ